MKAEIKRCFNKAALTYDSFSHIQQSVGNKLVSLIGKFETKNIIDLGCGTGLVTSYLAERIHYQKFYAIDIADKFILAAKNRLSHYKINVVEADFDDFSFQDSLFDLAFSNMSIQWSSQLDKTFANIHRNLANKGNFIFSLPLDGTFSELEKFSKNRFYSEIDITTLIHNAGFTLLDKFSDSHTDDFDSLFLAMKSIKSVGANFVFDRNIKSLSGKKNMFNHKKVSLTYRIGYFLARKTR